MKPCAGLQEFDRDFYAWSIEQAQLLREGRFDLIDAQSVAEEIEGMAKNVRHALSSFLTVLLSHLLKWQFQPAFRSKSWEHTIGVQREDVLDCLRESPSLVFNFSDSKWLASVWKHAVTAAMKETGLDQFPKQCPWRLQEEVLLENWLP
jgi:hypothetical protein